MSFIDTRDLVKEPPRRMRCRLPFNGTLSLDEARMLGQGIGHNGSDYEALLLDMDREAEVLEA